MKRIALLLLVVALWATGEARVEAQVGYVTHYSPLAYPGPYPGQSVTYFRPPVAVVQAAPVYHRSYYAPAPIPVYQPVTRVRTRYRPILGGTVTRVRHGYVPAYVRPAPVLAY